ncbi:MAG: PKD domain-containing protein [Bacteroidota bacterium]
MRKSTIAFTFLAALFLVMGNTAAFAQCTPSTITTPGIYPDPLPDGCAGQPYNEIVQFVFPVDTVISGFTIPFDSFRIDNVTNLPGGISYVCNTASCIFVPTAPGQPARGCAVLSGNPTGPVGPGNQLGITFTGFATVPIVGPQSLQGTIDLQLDINPSPTSSFGTVVAAQTVTFTNSSTGASSYLWDFGDGNTSTMFSPTHTYAAPGNYLACLITDNGNCQDTSCQTVTTGCPAPTATFAATPTLLSVAFNDQTLGSPTNWLWDFGDGNTSIMQNPTHTYAAPGSYTVCLTVTDTCGTDSSCQSVTVACPQPSSAFSFTQNMFDATFSDASTISGTVAYLWDFGDGNTSTMQNPTHTYAANGNYTACLTVTDDCGSDSTCQNVTVFVIAVDDPASFGTVRLYPNPSAGAFTLEGTRRFDLPLQIRVSDLLGKVVYEQQLPAGNSNFKQPVNLSSTAPGLYFVQLSAGSDTRTLKIRID